MRSYKQLLVVVCLGALIGTAIGLWIVAAFQVQLSFAEFLGIVLGAIGACAVPIALRTYYSQVQSDRREKSYELERLRSGRRQEVLLRGMEPDFPFKPFALEDLVGELTSRPVKFVGRKDSTEYEDLITKWNEKGSLLIEGRFGLGKKREAIELIRKFLETQSEQFTILVPQRECEIDARRIQEFLTGLPSPNIVLFIPDIHVPCQEDKKHLLNIEEYPFQERLGQVLDDFESNCRQRRANFRVIATIDTTPKPFGEIYPQHSVWQRFYRSGLPDLIGRTCKEFIAAAEKEIKVELEREARDYLHGKCDGTANQIITILNREKQNGKQIISLTDIKEHLDERPQDEEDYNRYVQPYPERVFVIMALDILHQARIKPHNFIVIDLAATLWGGRFFARLHKSKISDALTSDQLKAWIRQQTGVIRYSAAFISGKGDLKKHADIVTDIMLTQSYKSQDVQEKVALSLWSWAYVLDTRLRKPDLALKVVKRAVQLQPESLSGRLLLAGIYSHLGEHDKAASVCKEVLDIEAQDQSKAESKDPSSWQTLGIIYEEAGRYDDAIHAFRKANDIQDTLRTKYALGITLDKNNRHEEAISVLNEVVQPNAPHPSTWASAWMALGRAYSQTGDKYREAQYALERAIDLAPWSALAEQTLGRVFEEARDFERALQHFKEAVRKAGALDHDNLIESLHSLAIGYANTGDLPKALETIDQAIGPKARDASLLHTKGNLLRKVPRNTDALVVLRQANRLEPANPSILISLVTILNDLDSKKEAYDRVLGFANKHPDEFKTIGILYRCIRKNAKALLYLQKALALNSKDADVERELGLCFSYLDQYTEALPHLYKALEHNSNDADVERTLGFCLSHLDRYSEALPHLRKALERNSQDKDVKRELGFAYHLSHQYREALDYLEEALVANPKDMDVARTLASAYSNLKLSETLPRFRHLLACHSDVVSSTDAFDYLCNFLADQGIMLVDSGIKVEDSGTELVVDSDRVTEGLALLEGLREIMPQNPDVQVRLGSGYRKAGRPEDAISSCLASLKIKQDKGALYALGRAYLAANQSDKADDALGKAVKVDPDYAKAWEWRAIALERLGRNEEAGEARVKAAQARMRVRVQRDISACDG